MEALTNNPAKAHADVMKINKIFFVPEEINITDAAAIIKKPRYLNEQQLRCHLILALKSPTQSY